MFDTERFVDSCRAALAETAAETAIKELMLRTMERPGDVEAAAKRSLSHEGHAVHSALDVDVRREDQRVRHAEDDHRSGSCGRTAQEPSSHRPPQGHPAEEEEKCHESHSSAHDRGRTIACDHGAFMAAARRG